MHFYPRAISACVVRSAPPSPPTCDTVMGRASAYSAVHYMRHTIIVNTVGATERERERDWTQTNTTFGIQTQNVNGRQTRTGDNTTQHRRRPYHCRRPSPQGQQQQQQKIDCTRTSTRTRKNHKPKSVRAHRGRAHIQIAHISSSKWASARQVCLFTLRGAAAQI